MIISVTNYNNEFDDLFFITKISVEKKIIMIETTVFRY